MAVAATRADFFAALCASCEGRLELRALPSKAQLFVATGDEAGVARFLAAHAAENLYFGVGGRRRSRGSRQRAPLGTAQPRLRRLSRRRAAPCSAVPAARGAPRSLRTTPRRSPPASPRRPLKARAGLYASFALTRPA